MEKRKTITVNICDFCKEEQSWQECRGCGKDVCYDCRSRFGIDYPARIWSEGSDNGFYCEGCQCRLAAEGDELFDAYRRLKALRNEYKGWWADFDKRAKEAEAELERLLHGDA